MRGMEGIKEATVTLPIDGKPTEIKVAVAHTTANAAKVLDAIRRGEKNYHFIEVMACPGGCVHGGGQPHVSAKARLEVNPKANRANALYSRMKDKSSERLTKILRLKFSMKSSQTPNSLSHKFSIPSIKRKKSIARRNRLHIRKRGESRLSGFASFAYCL